jgi:hypothetical protein
VADAVVPPIEPLCVHEVKPMHPARQVLARRFDDEVEVVVEDAVGVQQPAEALFRLADPAHNGVAVEVVADDPLARDAANRHVDDAMLGKDGRASAAGHCDDGSPPARQDPAAWTKRH